MVDEPRCEWMGQDGQGQQPRVVRAWSERVPSGVRACSERGPSEVRACSERGPNAFRAPSRNLPTTLGVQGSKAKWVGGCWEISFSGRSHRLKTTKQFSKCNRWAQNRVICSTFRKETLETGLKSQTPAQATSVQKKCLMLGTTSTSIKFNWKLVMTVALQMSLLLDNAPSPETSSALLHLHCSCPLSARGASTHVVHWHVNL